MNDIYVFALVITFCLGIAALDIRLQQLITEVKKLQSNLRKQTEGEKQV